MKIEKKEGIKNIRIHHNKTVFWIIVVLFAALLFIVFSIRQIGNGNTAVNNTEAECSSDNDCVPAICCHPNSCVPAGQASACKGIMCTQECKPGTLDCQQGSCACIDNKCSVEWNAVLE